MSYGVFLVDLSACRYDQDETEGAQDEGLVEFRP